MILIDLQTNGFFLTFLSSRSFALPVIFPYYAAVAVAAILPKRMFISHLLALSSVKLSTLPLIDTSSKKVVQFKIFLRAFSDKVLCHCKRDKVLPRHIRSFCSQTSGAYLISDSHKTAFLSYPSIQIPRSSDIFFVLNVSISRFSQLPMVRCFLEGVAPK